MKYPFTEKGAKDLLKYLYGLPDTDLFLQADEIEDDFGTWLKANFDLSTAQVTYLDGIGSEATDYYGSMCALCFRHRLTINLIYPDPPVNPGYAKFPDTSNDLHLKADSYGNVYVTGSLTFTMVFEPAG